VGVKMSLDMLLGGTEHLQHLNAERNDLLWLADTKGMKATAIQLYDSIKSAKYDLENERMPDWYYDSKAVQGLRYYVSGLWRTKNGR
jgi:hypothetical protein